MSHILGNKDRLSTICTGSSVTVLGLNFYPIMMTDYEDFLACKDVVILRMGTLPVKYIFKDYLSAIFSFELDHFKETKTNIGLFSKFLRFLQLSLRIGYDEKMFENRIFYSQQNGEVAIDYIRIEQNSKTVDLTPVQISTQIRPILATLNGLELPDETENVDLVIANEQKKAFNSRGQQALKWNVFDLLAAVAYQSGCRERDLLDWTVREFEARREAIERDKRFTLYGQAEMGGMVQFKNGNPHPSWCFEVKDDSLGTQSLSELKFGNAKQMQE